MSLPPTDFEPGLLRFQFRIPALSFEDYCRGQGLLSREWRREDRRFRPRRTLVEIAILFAVVLGVTFLFPRRFHSPILVLDSYGGEHVLFGWSLLALTTAIFLAGVAAAFAATWASRRRATCWIYSQSQSLASEYDLELYEGGVISRSALGTRLLPWKSATALKLAGETWFLMIGGAGYYWIPDRNIADREAFRSFVEQRIAAAP